MPTSLYQRSVAQVRFVDCQTNIKTIIAYFHLELVTHRMVKPASIVIDVGISKNSTEETTSNTSRRFVGDVDFHGLTSEMDIASHGHDENIRQKPYRCVQRRTTLQLVTLVLLDAHE